MLFPGQVETESDKPKILFLDDSLVRQTSFKQLIKKHFEVDQAFSAAEAIELLEKFRYEQVFLDHDLGEELGYEVPSGMTVVDHICQMEARPLSVVIHSCNSPAAMRMYVRLLDVYSRDSQSNRVSILNFPELMKFLESSYSKE